MNYKEVTVDKMQATAIRPFALPELPLVATLDAVQLASISLVSDVGPKLALIAPTQSPQPNCIL